MKRRKNNLHRNTLAVVLALGCASVLAIQAAPAARSGKTNAIRSIFTLPKNPQQGRDPFFPDSDRPYEWAVAAQPHVSDINALVLKGFSGSLDHRLVIINNQTFAVGDEGDVITHDGPIHLRCVEIKTNSVVIEVGGQRHELFYSDQL